MADLIFAVVALCVLGALIVRAKLDLYSLGIGFWCGFGLLAVLSNFRLVQARADSSGLFVRRYFREFFVPWEQVDSVAYRRFPRGGARIEIVLDRMELFGKMKLHIFLRIERNLSLSGFLRRATRSSEPEVISWMRQQINAAKSRHPRQKVLGI